MRNIFLLMKYYLGSDDKFKFPKFDYQIKSLESMGFNVYYIGYDENSIFLCNKSTKELIGEIPKCNIHGFYTIALYDALYKATVKTFSRDIKFKYAYIRSMPITFNYKRALKNIKNKSCKVIVEIPSYPIEKEIKTEKNLLRKLYFKLSNFLLKKNAPLIDLFSIIGEDTHVFAGQPATNIENGIDIKSIPLRKKTIENKNEYHILALGNMAKWHGYDRVILGLKQYYNSGGIENVFFHLIGNDADGSLKVWEKLSKEYGLEKHVIFEGPKYGDELNIFFNLCHVAIGSVGLHRINYYTATSLKIREYMARGIPFIISGKDPALNKLQEFFMQVPENDESLNISKIIDFININKSKELDLGMRMRGYAKENMTWQKQFKKVFRKLDLLYKD